MKKITIIIITIILVVIVGYIIKCSEEKQKVQENIFNISEEITPSKHEEHEENADEGHEHDHFVEIEGSEMKNLTVQEVANLWEIDAEILLSEIIAEFELQEDYTVDTILEKIRDAEYKFSPAIIKDIAEEIKQE